MFVYMGKAFLPLVQPLGLSVALWLAALLSWLRRRRRQAAWLTRLGVLLLLVFSSPWVGARLLGALEDDYPMSRPQDLPTADAIVVLGGMTYPPAGPRVDVEVDDAFDRLLYGLRLWRAHKAPWVVLSGGVIPELEGSDMTEAQCMRSLALEYGIPDRMLLLEERSRTTRENAVYVARLLARRRLHRVLLVTSASHMRRALGTFRAVGLEAIPAPAEVRIVPLPFSARTLLPSVLSLEYSTQAVKEYLGWWVYRARGWVR